jgi:hypothetical protein
MDPETGRSPKELKRLYEERERRQIRRSSRTAE